jgi:hypothetical protein
MSGGDSYFITINEETTTTSLSEITLPISNAENIIEVKTNKLCQGIFKENIFINTSDLLVYPNPVTSGELFIELPNARAENIYIAIYAGNGSLVMEKGLKSSGAPVRLNVMGLTSGMYSLKIGIGSSSEYRKILIK